jgi:hypothetical protein
MKITTKLTNLGIEIKVQQAGYEDALKPAEDVNQERPRDNYVYAHVDAAGKVFYVGKGRGQRAWSTDRHPLWQRYVEKHLGSIYQVKILQDNLSDPEADQVEAAWIAQHSENLVNWINMGRSIDIQLINYYHAVRNANRAVIQRARSVEKLDLQQAVSLYLQAIAAIPDYALISYESGLVGELLAEEAEELGRNGEIEALDRLTMCLVKLGRAAEAGQYANEYYLLYRREVCLAASGRISKRIEKALACTSQ